MKYILYNDFDHILKNLKKLIPLFLIPLIVLLINASNQLTGFETFNYFMGTNLKISTQSVIELIMYLFNVIVYIYLIINIYSKDIEYQLDNIFLRMQPTKWFINKTILFLAYIFFIRMMQYLLSILVLAIFNNEIEIMQFVKLFFTDYVYISILQQLCLLIYIGNIIVFRANSFVILIFALLLIIIPKNIWSLSFSLVFLLLALILICVINLLIVKKHSKRLIQNV